jgi:hypothetical protein
MKHYIGSDKGKAAEDNALPLAQKYRVVITCPHCPKEHTAEFTVGIHPIFIPCDCGKIINGTAIVSPGGRASIDRVV